MDVSPVSPPPASPANRVNSGVSGMVKATSAGSGTIFSQADSAIAKGSGSSGLTFLTGGASTKGNQLLPTQDRLSKAVQQVNDSFLQKGQNLYASFEKDKITGINVVKIVDKKTNETITQMPPKEMVAFAQFLEDPQGLRGKLIHITA